MKGGIRVDFMPLKVQICESKLCALTHRVKSSHKVLSEKGVGISLWE